VPADRKWFARLAVHELLIEALEGIDPQWPVADFDVATERERLIATGDVAVVEADAVSGSEGEGLDEPAGEKAGKKVGKGKKAGKKAAKKARKKARKGKKTGK